jgi:hypothetical protein
MVDITTLQVNPIPPSILELQNLNTSIKSENKLLRNIIIVAGVVVVLAVANEILKQIEYKNERNRKGLQ